MIDTEHTELTLQMFLGRGIPAAEINNTQDSVPVYLFRNSPLFAELSAEQATLWAAQLRLLADQFERWAEEVQPETFPTGGRESEAN